MNGLTAVIGFTAVTAAGAVGGLAIEVRRRFVVVSVDGPSMQPTLWPGDRVLVRRAGLDALRAGQLVVVRRPGWADANQSSAPWLIKRAAAVPGDSVPVDIRTAAGVLDPTVPTGKLVVLGDNPAHSGDSRHWGYVSAADVLGVVVRSVRTTGP